MKPQDGLLETTNAKDNGLTVGGAEKNFHQVDKEGMQPKCLQATEGKNSLVLEETGMILKEAAYSTTNNQNPDQEVLIQLEHQDFFLHNAALIDRGPDPVINKEVSPAAIEKREAEMTDKDKAKLKIKLECAYIEVLLASSELISIHFSPKNTVTEQTFTAIAILGCLALLCGFFLLMHTLFILSPSHKLTPIDRTISKVLLIISCTTLVLASLPLSLLPKPYNILISIVLAAVLLTLSAYLYIRYQTSNAKTEKEQIIYNQQIKEIMRLSDLSQVVMSLSSGGLIGTLFGIHKNASNNALHPAVLAAVFLTFTSFIFSILFMFLCQMRLVHLKSSTRKNFLKIGEVFCKFLLVLLAFATLVVTYMFLKVYTVMIFIPVFVVYIIWKSINIYTIDHCNNQDVVREEELKLAYTKANKVTSVSFGGIMAIFSGYLGTVEQNMHLNICMIFLASAFLLGLCLMLLSYKPTGAHNCTVVNILSCSAVIILAFGGLAVFILEFI